MKMIMSFYSVCAPSYTDPSFWPDLISNTAGGATEAFYDPDFPFPTFILNFSFNLHFDLVVNSALDLFFFFHNFFSFSLSAIANSSSIWFLDWKRSWAMENTWSSLCRMIWARNAFTSKILWWDNCDVAAFVFSTFPCREVFQARRQSLSIVIFCTILSRETVPLSALHLLSSWRFWWGCVVSVEVVSAGCWYTTSVSEMASICL